MDEFTKNIRWDRALKNNLRNNKTIHHESSRIWKTNYRPFTKIHCYIDKQYTLFNCKHKLNNIFPSHDSNNRVICIPSIGSMAPFSAIMVETIPDYSFNSVCQCLPLYRYENMSKQKKLYEDNNLQPINNITDFSVAKFQSHYKNNKITCEDIFYYTYGIFHSNHYKNKYANDLAKGLPRIPFALDFNDFVKEGKKLSDLHLNYDKNGSTYSDLILDSGDLFDEADYRLTKRGMRYENAETKDTLCINDSLKVRGIPAEAHEYFVNGKTPLEWIIDRYRIRQDKHSGITNDPNRWFEDKPEEIVELIKRIVYLSVETTKIVNGLPNPLSKK